MNKLDIYLEDLEVREVREVNIHTTKEYLITDSLVERAQLTFSLLCHLSCARLY